MRPFARLRPRGVADVLIRARRWRLFSMKRRAARPIIEAQDHLRAE
jgi:hypothetical protein